MSKVQSFINDLYRFSQERRYGDGMHFIDNNMDFLTHNKNWNEIDSILYNIDFNKINSELIKHIIRVLYNFEDNLIMKKDFESRALDFYGKDKL